MSSMCFKIILGKNDGWKYKLHWLWVDKCSGWVIEIYYIILSILYMFEIVQNKTFNEKDKKHMKTTKPSPQTYFATPLAWNDSPKQLASTNHTDLGCTTLQLTQRAATKDKTKQNKKTWIWIIYKLTSYF